MVPDTQTKALSSEPGLLPHCVQRSDGLNSKTNSGRLPELEAHFSVKFPAAFRRHTRRKPRAKTHTHPYGKVVREAREDEKRRVSESFFSHPCESSLLIEIFGGVVMMDGAEGETGDPRKNNLEKFTPQFGAVCKE